jgi:cytoskeleton protein RodZ
MDKGSFGESLKREREMRGVTLEEISSATRIATRFLQAIETEKWEALPGGVFNRGFVRAVARYLGLDEENIVAEYTLAVGDRQTVPVWTGSPPAVTADQPWIAWIGAAVLILLLLSGAWFGARFFLARRAAKRAAQTTGMNVAPASTSSSASLQVSADSTALTTSASAQEPTSESTGGTPDNSAATAPILTPTDRFELKVEAAKKTKVTVVVDKDLVFDGTMKTGENQFFSAADHF